MRHIAVTFALAGLVAFATTAVASAKPELSLHLTGVLATHGSGPKTIRYTIVAKNAGNEPALKVTPVGKVPSGTAFVAGSASTVPGATVQYSLDGTSWSARPMISVTTKNGLVRRAADPSAYVAVRWIAPKVGPKSALTFTYEVRVK